MKSKKLFIIIFSVLVLLLLMGEGFAITTSKHVRFDGVAEYTLSSGQIVYEKNGQIYDNTLMKNPVKNKAIISEVMAIDSGSSMTTSGSASSSLSTSLSAAIAAGVPVGSTTPGNDLGSLSPSAAANAGIPTIPSNYVETPATINVNPSAWYAPSTNYRYNRDAGTWEYDGGPGWNSVDNIGSGFLYGTQNKEISTSLSTMNEDEGYAYFGKLNPGSAKLTGVPSGPTIATPTTKPSPLGSSTLDNEIASAVNSGVPSTTGSTGSATGGTPSTTSSIYHYNSETDTEIVVFDDLQNKYTINKDTGLITDENGRLVDDSALINDITAAGYDPKTAMAGVIDTANQGGVNTANTPAKNPQQIAADARLAADTSFLNSVSGDFNLGKLDYSKVDAEISTKGSFVINQNQIGTSDNQARTEITRDADSGNLQYTVYDSTNTVTQVITPTNNGYSVDYQSMDSYEVNKDGSLSAVSSYTIIKDAKGNTVGKTTELWYYDDQSTFTNDEGNVNEPPDRKVTLITDAEGNNGYSSGDVSVTPTTNFLGFQNGYQYTVTNGDGMYNDYVYDGTSWKEVNDDGTPGAALDATADADLIADLNSQKDDGVNQILTDHGVKDPESLSADDKNAALDKALKDDKKVVDNRDQKTRVDNVARLYGYDGNNKMSTGVYAGVKGVQAGNKAAQSWNTLFGSKEDYYKKQAEFDDKYKQYFSGDLIAKYTYGMLFAACRESDKTPLVSDGAAMVNLPDGSRAYAASVQGKISHVYPGDGTDNSTPLYLYKITFQLRNPTLFGWTYTLKVDDIKIYNGTVSKYSTAGRTTKDMIVKYSPNKYDKVCLFVEGAQFDKVCNKFVEEDTSATPFEYSAINNNSTSGTGNTSGTSSGGNAW